MGHGPTLKGELYPDKAIVLELFLDWLQIQAKTIKSVNQSS